MFIFEKLVAFSNYRPIVLHTNATCIVKVSYETRITSTKHKRIQQTIQTNQEHTAIIGMHPCKHRLKSFTIVVIIMWSTEKGR